MTIIPTSSFITAAVALESGGAYAQSGSALSGMGVDFKDVDNDGLPDIWHTAVEKESFPLFHNVGGGQFVEQTIQAQLAGTPTMSGWGNGIFDFDNDGWNDLFVARSNVLDNISQFGIANMKSPTQFFATSETASLRMSAVELGPTSNWRPRIAESPLETWTMTGKSMQWLQSDGSLRYLHNVSKNNNHWVILKLVGKERNRMGLGAQVRITTDDGKVQYNQATTAVGYASASDSRVHFGLGGSRIIHKVEISWPSGIRQVLWNVPSDHILKVEEQLQ
jgi:enediyne biosynthesis protein E4